jgi:WD40 repeat protein
MLLISLGVLGYSQARTEALFGHYSRGVQAFEASDYETAVAELEQADGYGGSRELLTRARQRLDSLASAYRKGRTAMAEGQWWDAAYWFRQATEASPRYRDASALLEQARRGAGYLVVQKPGRPVSPLYFGHADGGDLRRIPAPPGTYYPVALSSDGTTLLTIQFNRDGTTYALMDTASGRSRWLISLQLPAAARLAPDAGAVAVFPYRMGPEVRDLSPLNLLIPGGGLMRLADGWQQARADFSPSGRELAFSVSYGGAGQLFLYNLEGGELVKVASLSGSVESLSFGLDGSHLVATTFDGTSYSLTVVGLDGRARDLVRSPRHIAGLLGPDGRSLLYREGTVGDGPFKMKDLETGEEFTIFRCCGSAYQMPYFTADAGRLLFLSYDGSDVPNLYAVKPDGSDRLLVTQGILRFVAAPAPWMGIVPGGAKERYLP